MTVFLSILITVAIIFLIFLIICFGAFKKTFSREKSQKKTETDFYKKLSRRKCTELSKKIKSDSEIFEKTDGKDVAILGMEDVHLAGRLYLCESGENKYSVILCHGAKSSGKLDFGAAFKMYREMNYNILVADLRAHGRSEGKYCSMGILESYDVVAWCKWLEMCFGTESDIIVHGVSTGAFAAVAAAANPEMPQNIKCVIADSVYPLIRTFVFKDVKRSFAFLAKPVLFFMNVFYKNHVGFDMRDFSLFSVAKAVKIPTLFIHSENDYDASFSEAANIAKRVLVKSRFIKIKKAPHGTCFEKDETTCAEAIKKFIGEL